MQLTKTIVTALSLPKGRTDHIFWDDELPGFGLSLRFAILYRFAGQSRRESLGDPRKVSLDDARRAARARFAKLELGVDPGAERAKAKAAAEAARLTLALVSDRYLETRKPVVRPATHAAITRDLKLHWAPLRKRSIEGIKRPDIAARLGEITRGSGRAAAKRARVTLSAIIAGQWEKDCAK